MITKIHELLYKLEGTRSIIEKKKLISTYLRDDAIVEEVFQFALDPYVTFGVKPIRMPKVDPKNDKKITAKRWKRASRLLDQLASRNKTGNTARFEVERLIAKPSVGALVARILAKDLRCGVGAKIVNECCLNPIISEFQIALCNKDIERIKFPCWAEIKDDGVRAIVMIDANAEVEIYSRNGKLYKNFPQIQKMLHRIAKKHPEWRCRVYDGEIKGEKFRDVTTVARRKSGKDDKCLVFRIWDTIGLIPFTQCSKITPPQWRRRRKLKRLLRLARATHDCPNIQLMPGQDIADMKELWAYFIRLKKAGYEGCVVKDKDASYVFGRSNAMIKVKALGDVGRETFEGDIVKVLRGRPGTKYEGIMGKLLVDVGGIHVKVGSGFSDKKREWFWKRRKVLLGRCIEFYADEKIEDGSFRFPIFKRFRPDKD